MLFFSPYYLDRAHHDQKLRQTICAQGIIIRQRPGGRKVKPVGRDHGVRSDKTYGTRYKIENGRFIKSLAITYVHRTQEHQAERNRIGDDRRNKILVVHLRPKKIIHYHEVTEDKKRCYKEKSGILFRERFGPVKKQDITHLHDEERGEAESKIILCLAVHEEQVAEK